MMFDCRERKTLNVVRCIVWRFTQRIVESAVENAGQKRKRCWRKAPAATHRAASTQSPAFVQIEGKQRFDIGRDITASAAIDAWFVTFECQQLPKKSRGDQRTAAARKRSERTGQHAIDRDIRIAFLGEMIDSFEHRDRVREQHVALTKRPVGFDGFALCEDIQVAALVELQGDMARGLKARTELALGTPDSFGDGSHFAMTLGEDRDDPIGFSQLDRTQDNTLIPVQASHNHMTVTHNPPNLTPPTPDFALSIDTSRRPATQVRPSGRAPPDFALTIDTSRRPATQVRPGGPAPPLTLR